MRVSSMHVRALIEALQPAGVSLTTLFARAGLPEERLAADTTWFSLEEFDRLMVLALELSGDEALGLHWAERAPIMQYDLLTVLTAQAPSLRNAIDGVLRFQTIFADRPELELVETRPGAQEPRGRARFVCEPLASSELGLRVRGEVVVTAMVRLLRDVGWRANPSIERVSFRHAPPPYVAEYTRLFAGLVHFQQPEYSVEFLYGEVDAPERLGNAELHGILEVQAERMLSRARSDLSYRDQVRVFVERTLPRVPEMQEAAKALSLSERSLRRRLAEEGSSYSELVEQTQVELARRLLSDPTKSLKEVAFVLGFANTSGFHRAFKRWTGTSPATFRADDTRGKS